VEQLKSETPSGWVCAGVLAWQRTAAEGLQWLWSEQTEVSLWGEAHLEKRQSVV